MIHFMSNIQFYFDKNDKEVNSDESVLLPLQHSIEVNGGVDKRI